MSSQVKPVFFISKLNTIKIKQNHPGTSYQYVVCGYIMIINWRNKISNRVENFISSSSIRFICTLYVKLTAENKISLKLCFHVSNHNIRNNLLKRGLVVISYVICTNSCNARQNISISKTLPISKTLVRFYWPSLGGKQNNYICWNKHYRQVLKRNEISSLYRIDR